MTAQVEDAQIDVDLLLLFIFLFSHCARFPTFSLISARNSEEPQPNLCLPLLIHRVQSMFLVQFLLNLCYFQEGPWKKISHLKPGYFEFSLWMEPVLCEGAVNTSEEHKPFSSFLLCSWALAQVYLLVGCVSQKASLTCTKRSPI